MMRYLFLILLFTNSVLHQSVTAQSCQESLLRASKYFNSGQLTECIETARPCSQSSAIESERWQAFRLMSLAHIAMGNTDSARFFAENMLEINPTYKINPLYDPKDFSKIINSVIVIPKFTLGLALSVGGNTTLYNVTRSYAPGYYTKKYESGNSFLINTNIGLRISPAWGILTGLQASGRNYNIAYELANWKVSISEKLTYLELPVFASHYFNPVKRFQFHAGAGVIAGYLLQAQNDFNSKNTTGTESVNLDNINSKDRRNKLNYSVTTGAGMLYKTKQGFIKLEASYNHGLNNITNGDKRYNYSDQIYDFYYLDDDLKLSYLSLSIGYMYIINYKVFRKQTKPADK